MLGHFWWVFLVHKIRVGGMLMGMSNMSRTLEQGGIKRGKKKRGFELGRLSSGHFACRRSRGDRALGLWGNSKRGGNHSQNLNRDACKQRQ